MWYLQKRVTVFSWTFYDYLWLGTDDESLSSVHRGFLKRLIKVLQINQKRWIKINQCSKLFDKESEMGVTSISQTTEKPTLEYGNRNGKERWDERWQVWLLL